MTLGNCISNEDFVQFCRKYLLLLLGLKKLTSQYLAKTIKIVDSNSMDDNQHLKLMLDIFSKLLVRKLFIRYFNLKKSYFNNKR